MKNSFPRFVFVTVLSIAVGMAFAGKDYKTLIPGGATQSNCGGGIQLSPGDIVTLNQSDGTVVNAVAQGGCAVKDVKGVVYEIEDGKFSKRPHWELKGEGAFDGSQVQCATDLDSHSGQEICRTPSLSKAFKTIDEAVLDAAQSVQGNQCQESRNSVGDWDAGVGVEVHVNGYEKNDEFFYGDTYWFADKVKAAESAPGMKSFGLSTGLRHVFAYHNHPNTLQAFRSDFFSVDDWNSAQANNVPSYMMTCFLEGGSTTPRMLRLDPKTGNVHERHVNMSADGKLAYAGGWSQTPIYNFNGVLGWCACKRSFFEKLEWMGIPLVSIKDMEECCDIWGEIFGEERYVKDEFKRAHEEVSWCGWKGGVYYLCVECGKACKDLCIRPEEFPEYAEKLAKLVKSQNKQGVKELKMQSADFRRVSDGEIVVRGVCECSSPYEIRANFWTHVCKACGRLILEPKKK